MPTSLNSSSASPLQPSLGEEAEKVEALENIRLANPDPSGSHLADVSLAKAAAEARAQQKADAKALKDLLAPVSGSLIAGRILAAISAILAVAPYVALVNIGMLLLSATPEGSPVDKERVNTWLMLLLIAFMLRVVIYMAALVVAHLADIRLGHIIQRRIINRLSRTALNWFTETNSGKVRKSLQDDIATIHHLVAHQPVNGTVALIMPVALMGYAFTVDWRLGLLSIATIPLYATAMAFSMKGMGEKTVQMDRKLELVSARMVEFVTGITVVKAFGRVGQAHSAYQKAADEFQHFYYDWVRPLLKINSAGTSFLAVPLILVINIGGGALLVHAGAVSTADVLATSLIALLIPYGIEVLTMSMWSAQLAGAAATRLSILLETPVLSAAENREQPQGQDVVFDHVSYSYRQSPQQEQPTDLVLSNVSFTLTEGTVTALVGPSGSGKTTIATLLARFDDPISGEIRLGGVPLSHIENLYQYIGFVLQDPQLPSISIRDNIALGRPDATEEQIRAAASAARILDEIEALPHGFDTIYGSDTGLSGGQAQRIAIARALLVDAPVLILDEATALTDPESQYEIQQALSELTRGRTVLLIAHRPEVIRGVDQIVLIEHGRVVAAGRHEEMLKQPGYAQLWASTTTTREGGVSS